MTIGDLLDPVYVVYAPKTFILKLCIGLITGFVAHRIGKISVSTDKKHILKYVILASAAGLLFNMAADPLFGYYYKLLIIGKPAAELALGSCVCPDLHGGAACASFSGPSSPVIIRRL